MPIVQNINEENILFINDEIFKTFNTEEFNNIITIKNNNDEKFTVLFKEEDIICTGITSVLYCKDTDSIILKTDNDAINKKLSSNEIMSIELSDNDLLITTFKLPMFMFEKGSDDEYPKFDINISDCTYSMKIYISNEDYIDIPYYQSHNNINSTIDYINSLIFYLTESDKELINDLSKYDAIRIYIYDKDDKIIAKGSEAYEYKLGQDGIVLFGESFDDGYYLVEWHKFFKLLIDNLWSVEFIDKKEIYPSYTNDIETMI